MERLIWIGMFVAATALGASDHNTFKQDEAFPESRFGQPPARPDNGGSRFAARVGEVEQDDVPAHGSEFSRMREGSRRPAGLEFGQAPMTPQPAPRSAIPEEPRQAAQVSDSPLSRVPGIKKGVQEVSLIAGDLGYFPKTIFVTRDIPVRMFVTGSSKATLCIMMDSFQVKKQVRAQKIEEITFTPGTPGKYRFYCPIGNLEGTLVVREFASSHGDEEFASSPAPQAPGLREDVAPRAPASEGKPVAQAGE